MNNFLFIPLLIAAVAVALVTIGIPSFVLLSTLARVFGAPMP